MGERADDGREHGEDDGRERDDTEESDESDSEYEDLSETRLSMLRQRLDDKSRRTLRSVQFNIVASAAGLGLSDRGLLLDRLREPVTLLGIVLICVSTATGFLCVSRVGQPLDHHDSIDGQSLIDQYRSRNHCASILQDTSFLTGSLGVGTFLTGLFGLLDAGGLVLIFAPVVVVLIVTPFLLRFVAPEVVDFW